MNDSFDETICDRNVLPPDAEPKKGERSILLVIIAGSEVDFGRHFVLEKEEVTIGRERGTGIVIHDPKISKAPCAIAVVPGGRGLCSRPASSRSCARETCRGCSQLFFAASTSCGV